MQTIAFLAALQDPASTAPGPGPAAPEQGSGYGFLMPMALMALVVWFFMIRPERAARKKRESMLAAMQKGDKVITTGGLYGTVAQIQDDVVTLQVDEGVRLKFARSAVQVILGEPAAEPKKA